jgi:hypothetical protein
LEQLNVDYADFADCPGANRSSAVEVPTTIAIHISIVFRAHLVSRPAFRIFDRFPPPNSESQRMPINVMRPRSGVELVDASFQFFRENFSLLVATTLVAFAPIALVEYMQAKGDPRDSGAALVVTLVTWVFSSIAQAATILIVAERYMGNDITPADALRAVWGRIGTVLYITFAYGLVVGIGTLLLVVPGIYFAAKYFAAMAAAMVEGHGMSASMERSAALTVDSKLRVIGVFLVVLLVYILMAAGVTAVVGMAATPAVAALIVRLLMALTNPLGFILVTLLYFDLRIRREGLDIDLMMAPVATPSAAPLAG